MDEYLPISQQVQILFDEVQHEDGRAFTLQEVSDGTGVSVGTISQLKTGKIQNPQLNTLRELCAFFGVPLRYFETKSVEECYALIHDPYTIDDPTMSEIAIRATHLSPRAQRDILVVIKWVQAAEQARAAGVHLPPLPSLEPYDDE